MGVKAQLVVDVTAQCLRIGGARLVADSSGVLYWPAHETLLVADLHLEKGAHFAGRGSFLPPYDTRETLSRLADAIARYAPRRVIALGDSFHSTLGPRDMGEEDLRTLQELQAGRMWTWITGNHDPEIADRVGGMSVSEACIDGISLRHAFSAMEGEPEIAGHLHPVARLARGGVAVRRRCFVSDGRRLLLPAFGAYTGGLNVLDQAITSAFGRAEETTVLMLGEAGLYPVPFRHLRPGG